MIVLEKGVSSKKKEQKKSEDDPKQFDIQVTVLEKGASSIKREQKKSEDKNQFDIQPSKEFILVLAPVADRHGISVRAITEILAVLFVAGGGDADDVTLSTATVQRRLQQARTDAALACYYQEFPKGPVLVQWDGVRLKLGYNQGGKDGKFIEHLSITCTGTGGEQEIGVFQVVNGKGETIANVIMAKLIMCGLRDKFWGCLCDNTSLNTGRKKSWHFFKEIKAASTS